MLSRLIETVSPRPLGLTRIIVGSAAAIRALLALPVLMKLTEPAILYAPVFDWFPEPSVPLVIAIVAVWFTTAILLAVGWKVSWVGPLLLAAIVTVLLLDLQMYSNHLYLMGWLVLLLTVADAGAGLSLRRPERPVFRWSVLLLMMQTSIVYGFAGLTKLNSEFISGRVLAGVLHSGPISFPDALRTREFLGAMAIVAVFIELFLAVFLWSRRFRPVAFVLGLFLHIGIILFITNTGELVVFALEMLALYPLFLSRDRLRVVWDDQCASCRDWIIRFHRYDVLALLETLGKRENGHDLAPLAIEQSIHVIHEGETTRGFRAITQILEVLVPSLWTAPLLRLPGIRSLGERWYRWQAARRSCAVGARVGV